MSTMENVERMYFTVRDGFGDPIGASQYPTYGDAVEVFKRYCANSGHEADGAWLGIVFNGEGQPFKCVLVQHNISSMGSRYRSMKDNISAEALAIPEIKLAALMASQLQYPFDERTQQQIDELEKQLGIFDREVDMAGDLFMGKWRVHVVPPGGHYGLNNNLVCRGPESLVEFWDMSAKKSAFPEGQFVTRYAVESLYDTKWGPGAEALMRGGLCLDGDNADVWSVSAMEMVRVFDWLKKRELLPGEKYWRFSGEVDVPFDVIDHVPLPHMDSASLASEVALNQALNGIPFVRDLVVERMGVYKSGIGYTVSFRAQADNVQILTEVKKALALMPHEFDFEKESVPVEKIELDEVIRSCEDVSKPENKDNFQHYVSFEEKDR